MPGRIAVYPEVVLTLCIRHSGCAQRQHLSLRLVDVIDRDVEVELL